MEKIPELIIYGVEQQKSSNSGIMSITLLMEFEHNIPGIDLSVFELFLKIYLSFKKIIWIPGKVTQSLT